MADATVDLFQGLAAAPGDEFLRWIVRHLAKTLGCEWAVVLERCGDQWERTRVVAASRSGERSQLEFEVDAAGTPFEAGANGPPVVVTSGLRGRFPGFAPLAPQKEFLGESCVAIALDDDAGRGLGHLALIDARPLADAAAWIAALETFRARVAGELATRLAVRELEMLLGTTRASSSGDTLRALAAGLARALRVQTGFVCELLTERPGRVVMAALSIGGREHAPLEYDLEDTPCRAVYDRSFHFVPDDVQARFPKDLALKEMGARSFLGVRLDDSGGRPMGHLGVMHDRPLDPRIVAHPLVRAFVDRAAAELARRRAEDERLRAERRLADAHTTESIGVLAGGIAHDFNNLLSGILGHATLALAATTDAPEEARERPLRSHLKEIEFAARRAAELAQQLLAYTGRAALDVRPLDFSRLVDDTSERLRVTLPAKLELALTLSRGLPAVAADAAQLRQVVVHLIANGAEAIGDQGGTIRVATGRVAADRTLLDRIGATGLREGDYVFLEVADTGCGMDEATRARIFEPFFTTKGVGRGLGLAAVQGIVRGHRGAITVASETGRGSSFRLFLPACDEPVELGTARPRSLAPAAATPGGLVLVVDDDELVRTATARMLERLGFAVCAVADGRAGVRALAERSRDVLLVLLDLAMPEFTGEDAFHEMRRVQAAARIVLMSGYTQHEATQRLRSAGVAGFLQKPFGLKELERCVIRALASGTESVAG